MQPCITEPPPSPAQAPGKGRLSDASEPSQANGETSNARVPGFLGMMGRTVSLTGAAVMPVRGLSLVFAALRYRHYRNLWLAALVSNIGAFVQNVAVGWLVYELGRSEMWLGIHGFASQAPMVLLLPLGGVLADRLNRRWTIATGNLLWVMIAVALALLYGFGVLRVWHLVAAAALNGCVSAMLIPANQALLPLLVAKDDLPNAVALNGMNFNLSRVIGPAIGGTVMVAFGATWSFGLNALTFLPLLIVIMLLPINFRPDVKHSATVLQSMATGFRYLRSRSDLKVMEVTIFASGFFVAPLMQMLPAYVSWAYEGDAQAFSTLLSCFGAGAVIGAAAMAARSRGGARPWRAFPLLAFKGLCLAGMAMGPAMSVTMILVMLCGLTFLAANNRLLAAVLGSTPGAMRGRLVSLHIFFFCVGVPLGSLLAGFIGARWGIAWVFGSYGLASVVVMMAIALTTHLRGVVYHEVEDAQGA